MNIYASLIGCTIPFCLIDNINENTLTFLLNSVGILQRI